MSREVFAGIRGDLAPSLFVLVAFKFLQKASVYRVGIREWIHRATRFEFHPRFDNIEERLVLDLDLVVDAFIRVSVLYGRRCIFKLQPFGNKPCEWTMSIFNKQKVWGGISTWPQRFTK